MGKSCCYDRNLRDWWSYGRNLRQWWKLIWLSVAIPRHAFINWFAITNRLATQDILLKWGYKGDSLRLLQAHYVWVFQKNLERSYEEVLIRKPEFEMVQTCWMGFAWSEGEKSKLCKLVWGLSYIMFCIKVMLGYLRLTQEWRKWNTSHWGQVSIGNQSAMLLFEDASICTWQVNWNLYSLRKRVFPFLLGK